MRLAFRRHPLPLRLLAWFLTLEGTTRIVRWVIRWQREQPAPFGLLGLACMPLVAAALLFRGRRTGTEWLAYYGATGPVLLAIAWWRTGRPPEAGLIAGAVLGLALSAYGLWCRQRLPWQEPGSFGDWMTNPDRREGAARWFAERDRLLEADRLEPPDPDEVVRDLLDDKFEALAQHRIRALPEHFGPAVLRALDGPDFRRAPQALGRLVTLLPPSLHRPAGSKLVACLSSLRDKDRKEALCILAALGEDAVVPLLVADLAGEHAGAIGDGLCEAATADRLSSAAKQALTPALRAHLAAPKCPASVVVALGSIVRELPHELANAALAHDADEAVLWQLAALGDAQMPLPDDSMLTIWRRHRERGSWFWCFRLLPFVTVPDAELYELLDRLPASIGEPLALSHTKDEQARTTIRYSRLTYVKALETLCERHGRAIEPLLRAAIDLQVPEVSDGAAGHLLRLLGIPSDWGVSAGTAMTMAQRHLHSLTYADSYACNGGIVHALDCLSAEDMAVLTDALHEIAPPTVREIWLAAMRAVSPTALPHDRAPRKAKVMERYVATKERLDELSDQYFRCNWTLEVAMARFAIAHRDELVAHPPSV